MHKIWTNMKYNFFKLIVYIYMNWESYCVCSEKVMQEIFKTDSAWGQKVIKLQQNTVTECKEQV